MKHANFDRALPPCRGALKVLGAKSRKGTHCVVVLFLRRLWGCSSRLRRASLSRLLDCLILQAWLARRGGPIYEIPPVLTGRCCEGLSVGTPANLMDVLFTDGRLLLEHFIFKKNYIFPF